MTDKTKNEARTDINVFNFLTNKRTFAKEWNTKKINNIHVIECLSKASKSGKENRGEPDLIYLNENKKLLILIENKDKIKDHASKKGNKPQNFAIDGIKHYLSFFNNNKNIPETTERYLRDFKIIGIAFSGNINDKLNRLITTFIIKNSKIENINIQEFLNENDYLSLFENLDLELITNNISKSSSEINRILRNIDSQKRPVLLSALMICLYEKENFKNDFKSSYQNWNIKNIIRNIPTTINDILLNEAISQSKIDILLNELTFIKTDKDLNDTDILKEILQELENNVIPLFNKKTSYDIIGKFYEEFLRYAGISNVKRGIVLTPNHITKLFTELIEIKTNDIIFDPTCGTGAFLIAGMNKLIDTISNSKISDKKERIKNIKEKQLIGFEKSNTMYSLAISNMLFRGDGKSQIYNIDFFSNEATDILEKTKPTIGFINPPYGGRDNKSNPTKKEIQFIERILDNLSRYGIVIAPLSTFFKDDLERNRILEKHTLKYVINMPHELFQPNASTHTAIAVFETNLPHNDKEVVLLDLEEDGFVLSKNKGRTDVYNKWQEIKNNLLLKLKTPENFIDNIHFIKKQIKIKDEWIIQAHSKKDNTFLKEQNFLDTVKEYFIFKVKKELNLLNKNINEMSFLEILLDNYKDIILKDKNKKNKYDLDSVNWKEFELLKVFGEKNIYRGMRLVEADRQNGEVLYFSASDYNNGLTDSISNPLFTKKDALIYTTFGKCYYVEGTFTASDEISIFEHKKLNLFNGLFLATIISNNKYKYTFGRKAFFNKFSKDIISLPINDKNEINWNFMENFIKSLPYSSSLKTD